MDYKFKINDFEGPLDLLLHLIKESKMDIFNIEIVSLTNQYLDFISHMEELNLSIASSYLVMASELMYIKSNYLLPRPEKEDEDEIDAKEELINRLISSIEITRDDNYNIEIKNIKFTEEFISKSTKDYIDYLNELLTDNNIGITYKEQINKEKLLELEKDYTIMSLEKMENNQYSEEELNNYFDLMKEHFDVDGIINCPYIEGNNIVDTLILIPKTELINV